MTTDEKESKWKLYSQMGIPGEGTQWGIEFRPGYVAFMGWDEATEILGLRDEIEWLRSENKIIADRAAHHDKQDAAEIELLAARIKELKAQSDAWEKVNSDQTAALMEGSKVVISKDARIR